MYHSITIGDKNTWDDWKMIPVSRPVVAPPVEKVLSVDVPGRDGTTYLSKSLTGYPVFKAREGSWEFYLDTDEWRGRTFRPLWEPERWSIFPECWRRATRSRHRPGCG